MLDSSYRNIYIPENRSDTFQTQNHYNALDKNIQHWIVQNTLLLKGM